MSASCAFSFAFFFPPIFFNCLISRWQNYRLNREYHEDTGMVWERKKEMTIFSIFCTLIFHPSLTFLIFYLPSGTNCLIRRYLLGSDLKALKKRGECQRFTHATMNIERSSGAPPPPPNLDASPIHSLYQSLTCMLHFLCCILNSIYRAN